MKFVPLAILILGCSGSQALARDLAAPPSQAPPPIYDGPTFSFTGYFWATSLNGKSSTLPPLPATKIDLNFGDIAKDLNAGITAAGEIRLGRWGLLTDVMYSKVTPGGALPGPFFSALQVRTESLTLQGSVLYRVYTNDTFDLDFGPGARFWNLDNKLTVKPGALNLRLEHSEAENWIDPIVSARLIARINDAWSVTVAGDVGGFSVGSRFTYQVLGTLNYKWSDHVSLHAGYRLLSVDYKKGDFLYDVRMYGPILALTYRF